MGCCGKARKALKRGLAAPEMARRGPMVGDPMSRSTPSPESTTSTSRSAPAGGGYTVIPKNGALCDTCGTRTVLKRQYSTRLRRYFEVPWCSTCKAESR